MRKFRGVWVSWVFVSLLALLCVALAIVQSRWIYQISEAERERLKAAQQTGLARLASDFNQRFAASLTILTPAFPDVERLGSLEALTRQYQQWRATGEPFFGRVGLVQPGEGAPVLYLLNGEGTGFVQSEWPPEWSPVRRRFEDPREDQPRTEAPSMGLVEARLFGSRHGESEPPVDDWLVAETNTPYIRAQIPEMLTSNLGGTYDFAIVPERDGRAGFEAGGQTVSVEAAVGLLDAGKPRPNRPPPQNREGHPPQERRGPPMGGAGPNQPHWWLVVHHRGRSLEDVVAEARMRNLALSAGILLLIVSTIVALLRISRQSQELARRQVNFVAGVSHELRTPLTVIRTLAFNLRGGVAQRPERVEKYGRMIQGESEKLSILVDQVLRYGSLTGGGIIGEKRAILAETLIDNCVQASSTSLASRGLVFEKQLSPGLPAILADELAMRHVLQNLLDNAVKYGLEGSNWIGLYAESVMEEDARFLQIRVVDRGPGIPPDEQANIFDAFYRGRNAVHDQVHGTGLGLNLAKSIVEAHGGTIRLESEPMRGTSFVVRVPAAPEEAVDVFANTAG